MATESNNPNLKPEWEQDLLEKTDGSVDVTKLNKTPLIIIGAVVFIVIVALIWAGSTRNNNASSPQENAANTPKDLDSIESETTNNNEGQKVVNELSGKANDPLGVNPDIPQEQQAQMGQQPNPYQQQQGFNQQPIPQQNYPQFQPPQGRINSEPPQMDFRQQTQREFIIQNLRNAQKAMDVPTKTGLSTEPQTQAAQASANQSPSLMDKYMSQLTQQPGTLQQEPSQAEKNRKFLAESVSYNYLIAEKAPLQSRYEVKTGTVIPGVLLTGINSELPGKMKAQVSENVYDSATGRYLLIPQGTTLIGDYSSEVVYGQARVLVAWNRLVFPDGHVLNIGNMQGIDKTGYSGFSDQVDNHYARIFGSAMLMSTITAGVSTATNGNGGGTTGSTQSTSDAMISASVQQLGAVGTKMIEKNMNIAPTLVIRPGYKFSIFTTKDIKLTPLKFNN